MTSRQPPTAIVTVLKVPMVGQNNICNNNYNTTSDTGIGNPEPK